MAPLHDLKENVELPFVFRVRKITEWGVAMSEFTYKPVELQVTPEKGPLWASKFPEIEPLVRADKGQNREWLLKRQ